MPLPHFNPSQRLLMALRVKYSTEAWKILQGWLVLRQRYYIIKNLFNIRFSGWYCVV